MTRRQAYLVAATILVAVVAIVIGWQLGQRRREAEDIVETVSPEPDMPAGETMVVELFFPGPGGRLYAEEREIPLQSDLVTQLGSILDGLLAGPEAEDLFPALPPEVTVQWLHLNPAGIFYVDLAFDADEQQPAWGSRQEMLAVYSIVNTILSAAPEITAVVLLRDGQQRATFAGHLDTTRPLLADPRLVAQR